MAKRRQSQQVTVHHVANTTFNLDGGYSDLKPIGRGSYGIVCSAFSERLKKRVAIKKITPISKHPIDAKHTLREVRLMRHLGKHENVVTLEDLILRETEDSIYLVMELLDSDLHRIIQSKQVLTENHFRHFFFQLLCGLKYLHDNRIIHRDLKPGNLLVTKDCRLRITDFGLARERPVGKGLSADDQIDEAMTEHVVTRWYRPPELMLCPDGLYSYSVDIWSCGCILAEMLGRNPLFPGKNFVHQLSLVFDVLGCPPPSAVRHIINAEAKKFLASQQDKLRVPFSEVYPNAHPDSWALLDSLLAFDPDQRCTVDEALRSPYLRGVGNNSSLLFPDVSTSFSFSFENPKITRYQLKQLIRAEVESFRIEQHGPNVASVCPRGERSGDKDLPRSDGGAAPVPPVRGGERERNHHLGREAPTSSRRPGVKEERGAVAGGAEDDSSTVATRRRLRPQDHASSRPPVPPPVPQAPQATRSYLSSTKSSLSRASSVPRLRNAGRNNGAAEAGAGQAGGAGGGRSQSQLRPSRAAEAHASSQLDKESRQHQYQNQHRSREKQQSDLKHPTIYADRLASSGSGSGSGSNMDTEHPSGQGIDMSSQTRRGGVDQKKEGGEEDRSTPTGASRSPMPEHQAKATVAHSERAQKLLQADSNARAPLVSPARGNGKEQDQGDEDEEDEVRAAMKRYYAQMYGDMHCHEKRDRDHGHAARAETGSETRIVTEDAKVESRVKTAAEHVVNAGSKKSGVQSRQSTVTQGEGEGEGLHDEGSESRTRLGAVASGNQSPIRTTAQLLHRLGSSSSSYSHSATHSLPRSPAHSNDIPAGTEQPPAPPAPEAGPHAHASSAAGSQRSLSPQRRKTLAETYLSPSRLKRPGAGVLMETGGLDGYSKLSPNGTRAPTRVPRSPEGGNETSTHGRDFPAQKAREGTHGGSLSLRQRGNNDRHEYGADPQKVSGCASEGSSAEGSDFGSAESKGPLRTAAGEAKGAPRVGVAQGEDGQPKGRSEKGGEEVSDVAAIAEVFYKDLLRRHLSVAAVGAAEEGGAWERQPDTYLAQQQPKPRQRARDCDEKRAAGGLSDVLSAPARGILQAQEAKQTQVEDLGLRVARTEVQRASDVGDGARATKGVSAGAGRGGSGGKKKITIPVSPKFSTMSWQKYGRSSASGAGPSEAALKMLKERHLGTGHQGHHGRDPGAQMHSAAGKRAASAPRTRK